MGKKAINHVLYQERVTPSWPSFLPLLAILPTFWLTFSPINELIGIMSGLLVTAAVAGLMIFSSPAIIVSTGLLQVKQAKLETRFIGTVEIIEKSQIFQERGPKLDSRAFISLQASRKGLLKMQIVDPKDLTPYWLVSTKDAAAFEKALAIAKQSDPI